MGRAARRAINPSERTAKKSGTSHPNSPPPITMPPRIEFRRELNSPRSVVTVSKNVQRIAIENSSFPQKRERGKRCAKALSDSGAASAMRCLMVMANPKRRAMIGSMGKRLHPRLRGDKGLFRGYRLQENIPFTNDF